MRKKSKDAQPTDAAAPPERETAGGLRLTHHPRAQRHIARAKSWGGLVGFAFGFLAGRGAGLPLEDVLVRALGVGMAAYFLVWAGAVAAWRQVARVELDQMRQRIIEMAEAAEAEMERRRAELAAELEAAAAEEARTA